MKGKTQLIFLFTLLLCLASSMMLALSACAKEESSEGVSGGAGPVETAQASACSANRKTIKSALQAYRAANGEYPDSIELLVPQFLQRLPSCPAGGTYRLSGGSVSCSVHGE